jgi:heavy metal sensor kinase
MTAFGCLLYFQVRSSLLGAVQEDLAGIAEGLSASIERKSNGRFEVTLSEAQIRRFQPSDAYVIRDARDEPIDYSDPRHLPSTGALGARQRGASLDVVVAGPGETRIAVTRSIEPQLAQLGDLLGLILVIGVIVFAAGFAGGWFLIARILDPIRRITRTAAHITEADSSRRVDVTATESELADLARTLNSAFDRLEGALRRQKLFTADASHELRTPLSVLTTQMELALKRDRPAPEYREVMETCLKAVQRMTALVEGLLHLSRADAGALKVRSDPVDLADVVRDALDLVRPLAEQKGIGLTAHVQPHRIEGDREKLGEAVLNLVTNAIQYNRPDGRVSATLENGILEVADTGPGMPEEDRSRVFERFYRADKARARNAGGAGLGLAITKAIVEAHGGTIDFRSSRGQGTVFTVAIPAVVSSSARPLS